MEKRKKEGKGKPKSPKFPSEAGEKLVGRRIEEPETDLPPFPGPDEKPGCSPSSGIEGAEDIEEICRDLISIPFEVWAILKPGVQPLSEGEKKLIGKPLARVFQKYDVAKFMKDEFLLIGALGFSVMKRVRIKPSVKNDSRKTGEGENNPS